MLITGKVIHGDGFGKRLGFPTANLDRRNYSRQKIKVRLGIYAGWVQIGTKDKHKAAIVIGPMDKRMLPKIEAYLIGFSGNLYGKKISILLDKYIRSFKSFPTEKLLKSQINRDLKKIKQL